jgi:TPR repeat protein
MRMRYRKALSISFTVALATRAQARDPRATLALGSTYDPNVLGRLGVVGVQPQPEKAREWYEKAAESGVQGGTGSIDSAGAFSRKFIDAI